jgi:hypothetical protein
MKNKGCLIAAIVGVVLLVLCGGGIYLVGKKAMPFAGSAILFQLETDIAKYRELHPDKTIEPTNEAWAAALAATDSGVDGQPQWAQMAATTGGKLIDLHQNPLRIIPNPDGTISVRSNGKDGLPDTADDETSQQIREMMEKAAKP